MSQLPSKEYKDILTAGFVSPIIEKAREIVLLAGGNLPLLDTYKVTGDTEADYKKAYVAFGQVANAFTAGMDGFNETMPYGINSTTFVNDMISKLSDLEVYFAIMNRIADINAHKRTGAGGGIPAPGIPPWAARMQADITAIRAKTDKL